MANAPDRDPCLTSGGDLMPTRKEDFDVAKPEWGQKRTCNSCNCRFYDMTRTPIICPKCGATVETDLPFKVRRGGSAAAAAAAAAESKAAAPRPEAAGTDGMMGDDDDEALENDDAEEDEDAEMIEDTSDLGGDDDDMAEVMEHLDEEIEDEV